MNNEQIMPDLTATFDQLGAVLEGVAGIIGTYRRKLIAEGVDQETTRELCCMVAEMMLAKAMGVV